MLSYIKKFFLRTDWILLTLCLVASLFGVVVISSAAGSYYVTKQLIALMLGLVAYVFISHIDTEMLGEHMLLLSIFAACFLASLAVLGVEGDTGNRSWLQIPGIGFMIQPAEFCKIVYVIVVARIMSIYQESINSIPCISRIALVSLVFLGLIIAISKDAGVALIYVFAFVIMAIAGGFSFIWFAVIGIGGAVLFPVAWSSGLIRDDQKNRLLVLFDDSIDPLGQGIRYQTYHSMNAISGGSLVGQGLGNGIQTQSNNIPEQHTDLIFAVIGEELGYAGCALCILLMVAIIFRIIYVGNYSGSYYHRMICLGIAGTLIFQVMINIGMCIGMMPVIGVTLPFISYGGSSILSLFMAMGVINSIRLHPSPDDQQRYISLPI